MTSPQQCNAPWHIRRILTILYTWLACRHGHCIRYLYIYLRPARLSGVASEFLSDKAQLGSFAGQKNQLCPLCHICCIYYILLADGYCMYIVMNLQYLQRSVCVFRCTSIVVYGDFDAQFWLKLHTHNRYKRVMVILYIVVHSTP